MGINLSDLSDAQLCITCLYFDRGGLVSTVHYIYYFFSHNLLLHFKHARVGGCSLPCAMW